MVILERRQPECQNYTASRMTGQLLESATVPGPKRCRCNWYRSSIPDCSHPRENRLKKTIKLTWWLGLHGRSARFIHTKRKLFVVLIPVMNVFLASARPRGLCVVQIDRSQGHTDESNDFEECVGALWPLRKARESA